MGIYYALASKFLLTFCNSDRKTAIYVYTANKLVFIQTVYSMYGTVREMIYQLFYKFSNAVFILYLINNNQGEILNRKIFNAFYFM